MPGLVTMHINELLICVMLLHMPSSPVLMHLHLHSACLYARRRVCWAVTGQQDAHVLKRIFTERGPAVRLAGLREAYFGNLLRSRTVPTLQVCHAAQAANAAGRSAMLLVSSATLQHTACETTLLWGWC